MRSVSAGNRCAPQPGTAHPAGADRNLALAAPAGRAVDGHRRGGPAGPAVNQQQQPQQALVEPVHLDLLGPEERVDALAPRVLDGYALAQVRPGQGKVERDKRRGDRVVQDNGIHEPFGPLALHGLDVQPYRGGLGVSVVNGRQAVPDPDRHHGSVDPDGAGQPVRILRPGQPGLRPDLRPQPGEVTQMLRGNVEAGPFGQGPDRRLGMAEPGRLLEAAGDRVVRHVRRLSPRTGPAAAAARPRGPR